jgi:hypothetical protein
MVKQPGLYVRVSLPTPLYLLSVASRPNGAVMKRRKIRYFDPTRKTSPNSEEFDHGTCLLRVDATTSARTRVSIC